MAGGRPGAKERHAPSSDAMRVAPPSSDVSALAPPTKGTQQDGLWQVVSLRPGTAPGGGLSVPCGPRFHHVI